jgi:23S rRNA (uracil1939-C5)-methyltransferase
MTKDEISLEIVDVTLPDGYGVGKKDNFVFFVPGGVTGDLATVRVTREGKRFSYGEIVEMVNPSPYRLAPGCSHFGSCGGCTLQHIAYGKQLEIKENHLVQALTRIGGVDASTAEISPIVPAPEQFYSRNKIEMAFGWDRSGIIIGLRERVSPTEKYEGKVIGLVQCPAFSETLGAIIPVFTEHLNRSGLLPYDPIKKKGFLRRLTLRESRSTGKMMAILETSPGAIPDLTNLWRELSDKAPEIASFYRAINSRSSDTGLYDREEHLFGAPSIEETVSGLVFDIYPQSFFQPNTAVADLLYRTILDVACPDPRHRALGLYSGMGPIEMLLARRVSEVTGVDSNPANIINARLNCRKNGIENCSFIEGRVENLTTRLPRKPHILVIDPPRGGISKEGLSFIAKLEPEKFIYVSCNPSTLARDLGFLANHGYRPRKIIPFDAFPHTSHLETLALLERRSIVHSI